MSEEEVISSGLLESYVLGICTAEETVVVNDLCAIHPKLKREIELIEESLINLSTKEAPPLNSSVKEKISKRLFSVNNKNFDRGNVISLNPAGNNTTYKLGIAASILLLITSGIYIISLHQKVNQLSNQVAHLNMSKSFLADKLNVQQTSLETLASNFQFVSNPKVKNIALNGMNSLVSKNAVVHWNPETQEVMFHANALPASPELKQYQLWAIVNGKPVDAGMIVLENGGSFQKMKLISGAQAFAVTIENTGGSPTPSMDTMCLLGNV